jgi:hypothetical protein
MLASGQDGLGALAVDADAVYYLTQPSGSDCSTLKRLPKQGGAPTTFATTFAPVLALAVDLQNVYWVGTWGCPTGVPQDPVGLVAMPKLGGAPLFTQSDQSVPAQGIALDDDHAYWVSDDANSVRRAAKAGGALEVVYAGGDGPVGVAVDAANVYWVSNQSPTWGAWSAPKATDSTATALVKPPLGNLTAIAFTAIAVDASGVYYAEWFTNDNLISGGLVEHVSNEPTALDVFLGNTHVLNVALSGDYVYWTQMADFGGGAVQRVAKKDGVSPHVELVKAGKSPKAIAVDDTCVYWTDTGDGTIWKAPLSP